MAAKTVVCQLTVKTYFRSLKVVVFRSRYFYRELISNGCDAVTKLKKLDMMGEYALPEGYKGTCGCHRGS